MQFRHIIDLQQGSNWGGGVTEVRVIEQFLFFGPKMAQDSLKWVKNGSLYPIFPKNFQKFSFFGAFGAEKWVTERPKSPPPNSIPDL